MYYTLYRRRGTMKRKRGGGRIKKGIEDMQERRKQRIGSNKQGNKWKKRKMK